MTAAVAVSSASGLLSLLEEEDEGLRLHALQSLNSVVHEYWYQIASSIASVEAFYEDEEFKHRELAALVASKVRLAARSDCSTKASMLWDGGIDQVPTLECGSKRAASLPHPSHQARNVLLQVFYHLGELDDALTYALGAGKLFNIEEQSEYVQTIVGGFVPLACPVLRLGRLGSLQCRDLPHMWCSPSCKKAHRFICPWGYFLACCTVTSQLRTYAPFAAARCIDLYIEQRQKSDVQDSDERLASIVQRMFQR